MKKLHPILHWRHTSKRLFSPLYTSRRIQLNGSHENFWGIMALEVRTQKLYKGGF